jgi:DNA-binding response OmpR family regulator
MSPRAQVVSERKADGRPVVLVVEDELLARMSIAAYLREAGFIVMEAIGADDAMTVLAAESDIDAVFCDINLPGAMNGVALARWIGERRQGLPVLLTSGKGEFTVSAPIACVGYIAKPYIYGNVERRIRALIADR